MSGAQYVISSEGAQQKAQLLMELAGGKSALKYSHALEAVALGCGFPGWRELRAVIVRVEAGQASELGITPLMLADDLHVDDATLVTRLRNQLRAVRQYITCTPSKAQSLVKLWSLSDYSQAHGEVDLHATRDRPFPEGLEAEPPADESAHVQASSSEDIPPPDTSERIGESRSAGSGESPASSAPPAPTVAVSYRKRRTAEPR
jgi:hypothetical protein